MGKDRKKGQNQVTFVSSWTEYNTTGMVEP
jgi:hypothetical protein